MFTSVGIVFLNLILLVRAFFLIGDSEPVLFCIKVCPLYCSPRRQDEDASSLIYIDEPATYIREIIPYEHGHHDHEEISYHFDPYYFCKPPKPTTTTPAPTTMKTTTEEPTWICMVCMKKCTKYPKAKNS